MKSYEYIKKQGGLTGPEAIKAYGPHKGKTIQRVRYLHELGYLFIVGNNPRLDCARKWSDFLCLLVAESSSLPSKGYKAKTLWAIKPQHNINPLVEQP